MASASGADSSSYCDACPAGYGCKAPNVRMDCSAGFYCYGSTFTSKPNGYYDQYGEMCEPGYYCGTG